MKKLLALIALASTAPLMGLTGWEGTLVEHLGLSAKPKSAGQVVENARAIVENIDGLSAVVNKRDSTNALMNVVGWLKEDLANKEFSFSTRAQSDIREAIATVEERLRIKPEALSSLSGPSSEESASVEEEDVSSPSSAPSSSAASSASSAPSSSAALSSSSAPSSSVATSPSSASSVTKEGKLTPEEARKLAHYRREGRSTLGKTAQATMDKLIAKEAERAPSSSAALSSSSAPSSSAASSSSSVPSVTKEGKLTLEEARKLAQYRREGRSTLGKSAQANMDKLIAKEAERAPSLTATSPSPAPSSSAALSSSSAPSVTKASKLTPEDARKLAQYRREGRSTLGKSAQANMDALIAKEDSK